MKILFIICLLIVVWGLYRRVWYDEWNEKDDNWD